MTCFSWRKFRKPPRKMNVKVEFVKTDKIFSNA